MDSASYPVQIAEGVEGEARLQEGSRASLYSMLLSAPNLNQLVEARPATLALLYWYLGTLLGTVLCLVVLYLYDDLFDSVHTYGTYLR